MNFFPKKLRRAAGKDPVLALMPVPGEVDIVIASELMEAGRANTTRTGHPRSNDFDLLPRIGVFSMTEKIAMGDGHADAQILLKAAQNAARVFIHRDFAADRGKKAALSARLFLERWRPNRRFPFQREQFENAIRAQRCRRGFEPDGFCRRL